MAASIRNRSEERSHIENTTSTIANYCYPSSNNSQGDHLGSNSSISELSEEGDEKAFSRHDNINNSKDLRHPSPNQRAQDKGDFLEVFQVKETPQKNWGTSGRKRDNRIFPADFGLSDTTFDKMEDVVVPISKSPHSFYAKIIDLLGSVGKTIKNSFSHVFTSEFFGDFGHEVTSSEKSSYNNDNKENEGSDSDFHSEVASVGKQEYLVTNLCEYHKDYHDEPELPEQTIHYKDLVSEWLNKLSEVPYDNESTSSSPGTQLIQASKNFKSMDMDMLHYSTKRKYGDLEVRVGKSTYKVDSCFLQAQSTRFRQLLFWGCEDDYSNAHKDDYIPHIRLNDLISMEFEALMVYMYTGGYLLPSVIGRNGIEPSQRFLELLKIYGIPLCSAEK